MLIECDDKIELMALKTKTDGSGIKIGLTDRWRQCTNIAYDAQTGEAKIYSYSHKTIPKMYIGIQAYSLLPGNEQSDYIANYARVYKSSSIPDSYVYLQGNIIYLRICKLSFTTEDMLFSSRYRNALDLFHETRPHMIKYNNKGGNDRAFLESSRNKLNRWFKLNEYEYNIIFPNKEQGLKVFTELKESAKKVYETGIYMKGFSENNKQTTIKMYDMGHHSEDAQGVYKLEVTFRKDLFEKERIDITDLTIQEVCIDLLKGFMMREVLKLKGGEGVKEMQAQLFSETNILSRIIKLENETSQLKTGQTELRMGQAETNKEVIRLRKDLEKLIAKTGLSL